jgi:hypothetical protein
MPWRYIWGSESIASISLTSVLDGKWSVSRHGCFTLVERAPSTHWIESCVGLRAGLDVVEYRKILPYWESNLGRPARTPPLYRLSYPVKTKNRQWPGCYVIVLITRIWRSLISLWPNLDLALTDDVLGTAPEMLATRTYCNMHFTHSVHVITAGFPSAALHVNYILNQQIHSTYCC